MAARLCEATNAGRNAALPVDFIPIGRRAVWKLAPGRRRRLSTYTIRELVRFGRPDWSAVRWRLPPEWAESFKRFCGVLRHLEALDVAVSSRLPRQWLQCAQVSRTAFDMSLCLSRRISDSVI